MHILFITENFPPETNAAATRVFERACYWVKAGHQVTVITSQPNFPDGKLFPEFKNGWRQVDEMSGIRVVRVKTFIAANRGVLWRTIDFLSFMVTGIWAGLFETKPDVIAATSPQFFAAVGGWLLAGARRVPFVFELGDLWPASIAAVGAVQPGRALQLIEKLELLSPVPERRLPPENFRSKSNVNTPEVWSPRTTLQGSLGLVSISSIFPELSAPEEVVSK